MSGESDPLVVTLRCSGAGWDFCREQRKIHFPADRNLVPAHLSLFHHLPGKELDALCSDIRAIATPIFEFKVSGVRSLGRGVAFTIDAPPLIALHRTLAIKWQQWLTPQDSAKYSPHITIQNKVAAPEARKLLEDLRSDFIPFAVQGIGVEIWHYRGGPWEPAAFVPFT